ncbi:MAG: hypothetical protein HY554_07055 [Elusimicrobia bacterium]|nr:hypothetical protein [Elusimicrobiota bacterium]
MPTLFLLLLNALAPELSPGSLLMRKLYFDSLDRNASFIAVSSNDPVNGFAELLGRKDVPRALERHWRQRTGSRAAARVWMALEYSRGFGAGPLDGDGLTGFLENLLHAGVAHARRIEGRPIFPHDRTLGQAFQDRTLIGFESEQLPHLLVAVEAGLVVSLLERDGVGGALASRALGAVGGGIGEGRIAAEPRDWARAVIIGHELVFAGVAEQFREYDRLLGEEGADLIRWRFDSAVAAVREEEHAAAWEHIAALASAAELPSTAEESTRLQSGFNRRFGGRPIGRWGNSVQDLALSVYGFALGEMAAEGRFPDVDSLQAYFLDVFRAGGERSSRIDAEFWTRFAPLPPEGPALPGDDAESPAEDPTLAAEASPPPAEDPDLVL